MHQDTLTPSFGKVIPGRPAHPVGVQKREPVPEAKPVVDAEATAPYLNHRGELIIAFAGDPQYHWWAGGQSIATTLEELHASAEVRQRYTALAPTPAAWEAHLASLGLDREEQEAERAREECEERFRLRADMQEMKP
jgi:hypothetical protein